MKEKGAVPVGWVMNLNQPVNQHDFNNKPFLCPRGAIVPVFDEEHLAKFQRGALKGRYKVFLSETEFKVDEPPPTARAIEIKDPVEGESHPLNFVKVVGEIPEKDFLGAQIELSDGKIVPLAEIIEGLRVRGSLEMGNAGWITLFPGTDAELKLRGLGKIIEGIQENPGLFMPPPAEAKE